MSSVKTAIHQVGAARPGDRQAGGVRGGECLHTPAPAAARTHGEPAKQRRDSRSGLTHKPLVMSPSIHLPHLVGSVWVKAARAGGLGSRDVAARQPTPAGQPAITAAEAAADLRAACGALDPMHVGLLAE